MIRGLVIGKFMPIHKGHIALIEFAARRCDELIVSMSYTDQDTIPMAKRFSWLQEIFRDRPAIVAAKVEDDFDEESAPINQRTKIWSDFVKRTYPPIDVLFASETYGESFAQHLGARFEQFDIDRIQFPVSATSVRHYPLRHWDFIPEVVRPYFVKKICFYGPESTGKSTLAESMAAYYKTEFVPEVAREMITSNQFTVEDIIAIGQAQNKRIKDKSLVANKFLFCDTDIITTQIYSQHYLGVVPEVLFALENEVEYDAYFLMDIDVPWIPDGLRDLGGERDLMMKKFKAALDQRGISYTQVSGTYAGREKIIQREIDRLFG